MAAQASLSTEPPAAVVEARIRKGMIDDANEMVSRLALALLLSRDPDLQALVRRRGGADESETVQVRLPESQTWLVLGGGKSPSFLPVADPSLRQIDFEALVANDEEARAAMVGGLQRTNAHPSALNILAPLFNAGRAPTRRQIAEILPWAPVLDRVAYRFFARSTSLLDLLRPALLKGRASASGGLDALREGYWSLAHTGGQVGLLATIAKAAPWLVEMADQFAWVTWTPTFPLLRERTLWLALVASRSAQAFGPPVIGKYLDTLGLATHPLRRFDALFGLLAIGLGEPGEASSLAGEIETHRQFALRQEDEYRSLTAALFDSALRTLREPASAAREFAASFGDSGAAFGRGMAALRRADPTDILPTSSAVGFIALAALAQLPTDALFSAKAGADPLAGVRTAGIGEVVERAWGGAGAGGRRVVH